MMKEINFFMNKNIQKQLKFIKEASAYSFIYKAAMKIGKKKVYKDIYEQELKMRI